MSREKVPVRCQDHRCRWEGKRPSHALGHCPRCHIEHRGNTPVVAKPKERKRRRLK